MADADSKEGSAELARALAGELDRRIAELSREGEGAFGKLGFVDLVLIAGLFLLVPLVCVWLAA